MWPTPNDNILSYQYVVTTLFRYSVFFFCHAPSVSVVEQYECYEYELEHLYELRVLVLRTCLPPLLQYHQSIL